MRTFAPFVAGVGDMNRAKFFTLQPAGRVPVGDRFSSGAVTLFGNVPLIKENFGIVTILIIVISVMPVVWELIRPNKPAGA